MIYLFIHFYQNEYLFTFFFFFFYLFQSVSFLDSNYNELEMNENLIYLNFNFLLLSILFYYTKEYSINVPLIFRIELALFGSFSLIKRPTLYFASNYDINLLLSKYIYFLAIFYFILFNKKKKKKKNVPSIFLLFLSKLE